MAKGTLAIIALAALAAGCSAEEEGPSVFHGADCPSRLCGNPDYYIGKLPKVKPLGKISPSLSFREFVEINKLPPDTKPTDLSKPNTWYVFAISERLEKAKLAGK